MNQEFITYEQALSLKELGFDEPCFDKFYTKPNSKMFSSDEKGRYYPIKNISKKLYTIGEHFVLKDSNVIVAPLKQQVFRWFREKHKIISEIRNWNGSENQWYYMIHLSDGELLPWRWEENKTYEEAENACIDKLIKIVKNK